ncbi:AaceriAFR164Wp [[Ashbya] aceris (nom. inval.)]|nr:AaceriAFR164Wp [[Ashbya] aceris (nom. inval.)]
MTLCMRTFPRLLVRTMSTVPSGQLPYSLADIRIGKILSVREHPDSYKMYITQVSFGELGTKQICTGLRDHVSLSEMQDSLVVVLNNIKKCKLRGEASEAMMLCAEYSPKELKPSVQLLRPATPQLELCGAQVLAADSLGKEVASTSRRIKPAEWEELSSRLSVDKSGRVVFQSEGKELPLYVNDNSGSMNYIMASGMPAGSQVR